MRIFDIFPYFNEIELLELRVNLLKDVVDKFIICDANVTHSGVPKEFSVNTTLQKLGISSEKIVVLELDFSGWHNATDLEREREQRNIAARFIEEDTIAFVSDCDEIMNPRMVKYYAQIMMENPEYIVRLPMAFLSGRADLQVVTPTGKPIKWDSGFVCMEHHLKTYTLSDMREAGAYSVDLPKHPNIVPIQGNKVEHCGWHFSWMGTNLASKFKASLHANDHIPNAINTRSVQSISSFMETYIPKEGATDPFGRQNHLLAKYDQGLLPDLLFKLPRVYSFLLPRAPAPKPRPVILFHDNQLNERGTSVGLYDYAYYAREFLNLDSIVVFDRKGDSNQGVILKFQKEFITIPYHDFSEVQGLAKRYGARYFFAEKSGEIDHIVVSGVKNLIHSVFNFHPAHKHGDVYAVISEWMSFVSGYQFPYVPYMLNLPTHEDNLRMELGIPEKAVVVGRYGGFDTFDLGFVPDVIRRSLEQRSDLWFVFMNTPRAIDHPRCIYLDLNIDLAYKVAFINTCDAMLHARFRGESFGLAVLEFAAFNKHIITFDNYCGERNHHLLLRNNVSVYLTPNELESILEGLTRVNPFYTGFLRKAFSPEAVMAKFEQVYL